jgi:hypothetical protein
MEQHVQFGSYTSPPVARRGARRSPAAWLSVLPCRARRSGDDILSGDQGMIVWWSIRAGVHVEPHSHVRASSRMMLAVAAEITAMLNRRQACELVRTREIVADVPRRGTRWVGSPQERQQLRNDFERAAA